MTEMEINNVINLKSQHWNYEYDLQRDWLSKSLNNNDLHLWVENANHEIIAYMNHVFVECLKNNEVENMIGIGNVCVSNSNTGRGVGKLLMQISNFYISELALNAILLCRDELKSFYHNCGWQLFEGEVQINSMIFDKNLFSLHKVDAVELSLNRNF